MILLSSVLDPTLTSTVVQATATFVAIIAGFYTTKIIALSTEIERLKQRLREILGEITYRNGKIVTLQQRQQRVDDTMDEDMINIFLTVLLYSNYPGREFHNDMELVKFYKDIKEVYPYYEEEKYKTFLEKNSSKVKKRISKLQSRLGEEDFSLEKKPNEQQTRRLSEEKRDLSNNLADED